MTYYKQHRDNRQRFLELLFWLLLLLGMLTIELVTNDVMKKSDVIYLKSPE